MIAAYYQNAYTRTLSTEVVRCTEASDGRFAITLLDTILFPEGGGQPADRGTLAGIPVLDLQRMPEGEVLHITSAPVAAGPVEIELDWERRYDHMQQHTAQHLITALAHDHLGLATTSFHLGLEGCSIDLDGTLEPASLLDLEDRVNTAIREARSVRSERVTAEEFSTRAVRTRGLPKGHTGTVRLIEIDGIDLNTCGGTHVQNTAELQHIVLIRREKHRAGTRLHYVAGERTRRTFRQHLERSQNINRLLDSGPEEHIGAIEHLLEARRSAKRERRNLNEELAQLIGNELARGSGAQAVVACHREQGDLQLLSGIARSALQHRPELLLLLTASGPEPKLGFFMLAGPEDIVRKAGPIAAELLKGRGGGARGRFQGKAERLDAREQALLRLRTLD